VDLRFLATTGDSAWAVDEQQRIIFWNAAAVDLFGYTAEETIGRYCYEITKGQTELCYSFCQPNCRIIEQSNKEEVIEPENMIVTRHDGQEVLVNTSSVVVSDPESDRGSKIIIHLARRLEDEPTKRPGLRIQLLGRIHVRLPDGSSVQGSLWQRQKVRALLAYLAMRQGQPVHRETLLEIFWPDMVYETGLHNLNTAVYSLRRCLEPDLKRGAASQYIQYESHHYKLRNGRTHWLDVSAFESNITQASQKTNHSWAISLYKKALALYSEAYLAELDTVMDWHLSDQRRLCELYLSSLENLASLLMLDKKLDAATEEYLQVLAVDPCREKAAQGLMRLSLQKGDRATAVVHYHQLCAALEAELDVRPSRETRQIYRMAGTSPLKI
jgi:PAS domain S-box-containing protein